MTDKKELTQLVKEALLLGAADIIGKAMSGAKLNVATVERTRGFTQNEKGEAVHTGEHLLVVKVGYCEHVYVDGECRKCETPEPKPEVEPTFCDQDCQYLSISEREQDKSGDKPPHMCNKYGVPLIHGTYHPRLISMAGCDGTGMESEESESNG